MARQLPYIEDALPALFFAGAQTGQLPEPDRLLLAMATIDADTRAQAHRQSQGCAAGAALRLARRQRGAVGQGDEVREKPLVQLADDFVKVRAELQSLAQLQTQSPSSAVLAACFQLTMARIRRSSTLSRGIADGSDFVLAELEGPL